MAEPVTQSAAQPERQVADRKLTAVEYGELSRRAAMEMSGGKADETLTSSLLNLLRIANRLVRDFEVAVYEKGAMSWAGYQLLFTLKAVGPMHPKTLARIASVSSASMSSLLNTMHRKGLIERAPDPTDGRRQIISLSTSGAEMVRILYMENLTREEAWSTALDPIEFEQLNSLLKKLLGHRPASLADDRE